MVKSVPAFIAEWNVRADSGKLDIGITFYKLFSI